MCGIIFIGVRAIVEVKRPASFLKKLILVYNNDAFLDEQTNRRTHEVIIGYFWKVSLTFARIGRLFCGSCKVESMDSLIEIRMSVK